MKRTVPQTHYVYEFSYPEGMPELAGTVFYVGKGTTLQRMNNHLDEAATGCDCRKCKAIRSIWDANLVVVRRIVYETLSNEEALREEQRRILLHRSPFLTNIQHTAKTQKPTITRKGNERPSSLWRSIAYLERLDEEYYKDSYKNGPFVCICSLRKGNHFKAGQAGHLVENPSNTYRQRDKSLAVSRLSLLKIIPFGGKLLA